MSRRRILAFIAVVDTFALLQYTRFYSRSTYFYLHLHQYLAGQERLPFQERVLPILILKPLNYSNWVQTHLAHTNGAFTPELGPFYALSFVCLFIACAYVQWLYEIVSPTALLRVLVFPIFLFTIIWTYVIHSEANFSYPYDAPSLAFFAAGLCYIYAHRFLPLFIIMLVGTFNRETTLFLVGFYIIDSATVALPELGRRFDLRQVNWWRVCLLTVTWAVIHLSLERYFRGNDRSEDFLRISYNLHQMKLRLIPALLNICGYTLPMVLVFQRFLTPQRFKNYLWILPAWFAVMFCAGVIVETRIYGELCPYCSVAVVLILERYVNDRIRGTEQQPDSDAAEPMAAEQLAVEAAM